MEWTLVASCCKFSSQMTVWWRVLGSLYFGAVWFMKLVMIRLVIRWQCINLRVLWWISIMHESIIYRFTWRTLHITFSFVFKFMFLKPDICKGIKMSPENYINNNTFSLSKRTHIFPLNRMEFLSPIPFIFFFYWFCA